MVAEKVEAGRLVFVDQMGTNTSSPRRMPGLRKERGHAGQYLEIVD
jgi:hypothetical protein